jgi:hypothetical protein
VLAGIKVRKGHTLLDETRAWVKAGRALGVCETRKAVLTGETPSPDAEAPTVRSDNASARNGWVQAVNAVLSNAKLLKGKHAGTFAPVLREFRAAEAKADQRATRRRETNAAADPIDAPAPPAVPVATPPQG